MGIVVAIVVAVRCCITLSVHKSLTEFRYKMYYDDLDDPLTYSSLNCPSRSIVSCS